MKHHYDLQIAKQLAFLKKHGLRIHIPLKGAPYFTKSSKK